MKYILMGVLVLAVPFCAGCGFTAADRATVIYQARSAAKAEAIKVARQEALKHGYSEEEAAKVGDLAGEIAAERTGEMVEKIVPESDEPTNWGGILATIMSVGLSLMGAGVKS